MRLEDSGQALVGMDYAAFFKRHEFVRVANYGFEDWVKVEEMYQAFKARAAVELKLSARLKALTPAERQRACRARKAAQAAGGGKA